MVVMQDLRVMELLASRICHDLISPVGAINNGIELLEEMGAQVGEEAVKLIGHSAEQASRRLRLFRLCYGSAGADSNLSCDDVLIVARDYLLGSRVSLNWDSAILKPLATPKGAAKVLLNCVIIAMEILVHGGTIDVSHEENSLIIKATGRGAGQRDDAWPALRGEVSVEDLTARSVHPHVVGRFAQQFEVVLDWQQPQEDMLTLVLKMP